MNRDQKATAIAEIAGHIDDSQAIFAVDYRGISVAQVAELRTRLREADATFKVVKNSLTERAADQSGSESLKEFLAGPTALTFVRGDVAMAAKAIADYGRATQLLPFKGGLMDGATLDAEQIRALSRLPSREVLYGQLVGVVASPIGGLVRSLSALLGGLAIALGQVREKKESGEIPGGGPAAAPEAGADAGAAGEAQSPPDPEPAAQAEGAAAPASEAVPGQEPDAEADAATGAEAEPAGEAEPQDDAGTAPSDDGEAQQAEPAEEPATEDANQADVSAESQPEDAETSPKED